MGCGSAGAGSHITPISEGRLAEELQGLVVIIHISARLAYSLHGVPASAVGGWVRGCVGGNNSTAPPQIRVHFAQKCDMCTRAGILHTSTAVAMGMTPDARRGSCVALRAFHATFPANLLASCTAATCGSGQAVVTR